MPYNDGGSMQAQGQASSLITPKLHSTTKKAEQGGLFT
jgi:hypothetical protein